jgi:hypothetical protein
MSFVMQCSICSARVRHPGGADVTGRNCPEKIPREPIWSAGTYYAQWRNNAAWAAGELGKLCSADSLNRLDADGRPNLIPMVSIGLTDDRHAYRLDLPASDPSYGKYSEAAAVRMPLLMA